MTITTFTGPVKSLNGFINEDLVVSTTLTIPHNYNEGGAGANALSSLDGDGYARVTPAQVTGTEVYYADSDGLNPDAGDLDYPGSDFELDVTDAAKFKMRCKRDGFYRFHFSVGYYELPTADTGVTIEWYGEETDDGTNGLGLCWGRGTTIHNGTQGADRYFGTNIGKRPAGPRVLRCEEGDEWGLWVTEHGLTQSVTLTYADDASFNYFVAIERLR